MRQLAPAAGVQLMPRLHVWPVYLIALPVLVIASLVVESGAIEVVNSFHVPGTLPVPTRVGITIDLDPGLASGHHETSKSALNRLPCVDVFAQLCQHNALSSSKASPVTFTWIGDPLTDFKAQSSRTKGLQTA
jgi:hypothetical protein